LTSSWPTDGFSTCVQHCHKYCSAQLEAENKECREVEKKEYREAKTQEDNETENQDCREAEKTECREGDEDNDYREAVDK
jgi:hypothetical protein